MRVKIKRIDKTLALPQYHTSGSVAFDLCARIQTVVAPFKPTIIPLNIVIQTPANYFLALAARSSLPLKKGLMVANGIGIIDKDYCGDKDEIGLQVLNFTDEEVIVKKGERIAQAMLVKIGKVTEFKEVSSMKAKSRGGFGSTG